MINIVSLRIFKRWVSLRTAQQEAEKPIAESGGKM